MKSLKTIDKRLTDLENMVTGPPTGIESILIINRCGEHKYSTANEIERLKREHMLQFPPDHPRIQIITIEPREVIPQ